MDYVIPPPPPPPPPPPTSAAIAGSAARFPVRRIYCVGRNYAEHAAEMGHSGREPPFFFLKPADALLPVEPGAVGEMPYPPLTSDLHHEVELVVALGTGGRDIPVDRAAEHIWGYAVGLDMTRRDRQAEMKKAGRPWSIAKGFDASAPLGPVSPAAAVPGIGRAPIALDVNGTVRQLGHIDQMIWSVPEIIARLSTAWALAPGDLIFTGTPAGVAAVGPGDLIDARIEGLEPLRVRVVG